MLRDPPAITMLVFEIRSEALDLSWEPLLLEDEWKKLLEVSRPYSASDVLKNCKVEVRLKSSSVTSSPNTEDIF
jgi:hypothetical protein